LKVCLDRGFAASGPGESARSRGGSPGSNRLRARKSCSPRGKLRWTVVGILCYDAATTAYYCSAIFPGHDSGQVFQRIIMEVIGRRWSVACFLGALALCSWPGCIISVTVVMAAGSAVLSSFPAVRSVSPSSSPRRCAAAVILRRGDWADLLRCAEAILPGTVHRSRHHLLRDDRLGGGDRRLHSAAVRQGNGSAGSKLVTEASREPVAELAF
jgi:hypothetical protein